MIIVHLAPYSQEYLKFAPMRAATVLSTLGAGDIAGTIFMGLASDRIGPERALAIATTSSIKKPKMSM